MKAFEAADKNTKLVDQVKRKDMRLRAQHNELVGLGQLKSEADKYHHETTSKLQKGKQRFPLKEFPLNRPEYSNPIPIPNFEIERPICWKKIKK